MARTTIKVAQMRGLWRVKSSQMLRWPSQIMLQENHPMNARGKAGYVIDMDKEYNRILCWGMEKFIEQVPASETDAAKQRVDDPYTWPRPVINFLADRGLLARRKTERKPRADKLQSRAQEQPKPASSLIPDLDESPKAPKRSTKKQTSDEGVDI